MRELRAPAGWRRPTTLPQACDDEALPLAWFWYRLREHRDDPLALLIAVGAVEVRRPPDWSLAAVREQFAQLAARSPHYDRCLACGTVTRRRAWHHLVWISHGGSNTYGNVVALCDRDHQRVHSWLPDPDAWASLRDIAPCALANATQEWR